MLFVMCYRKSLCNKHNVTVSFVSEDVTEDVIVRDLAVGTVAITVRNKGAVSYQLLEIFTLCELNEMEKNFPTLPLHLKPGKTKNSRLGIWLSGCKMLVCCARHLRLQPV